MKKEARNTVLYFFVTALIGGLLAWVFNDFLDRFWIYGDQYEYPIGYIVAVLLYVVLVVVIFFIRKKIKINIKIIAKTIIIAFLMVILYLFALNGRYTKFAGNYYFDKWKKEIIKIERVDK